MGTAHPPVVEPKPKLIAEAYTPPDPGPYPQDKPPENAVCFTPVQVTPLNYVGEEDVQAKR